jgi:hypothetical protein
MAADTNALYRSVAKMKTFKSSEKELVVQNSSIIDRLPGGSFKPTTAAI